MAGKNFIDFIIATKNNESLLTKFLECDSKEALQELFKEDYDISEEDCIKLIKAKEELGIEQDTIPPAY
ncbi:MAG: hypothetical protein GY697_23955 [Desulfobacterales bacterium]|nr:hypothetical protein [Desulfobacterales bacterium]